MSTHSYDWPSVYLKTNASAILKRTNNDFCVIELPLVTPQGEGEHIWLYVKKDGANTNYVAQCLADFAKIKEKDVGYAGLKDRHAITEQWFSIYYPKGEAPNFLSLKHNEFTVLEQTRHIKKLRRGDLLGNTFNIVLRNVQGNQNAIETNLAQIQTHGVPNYFGAQRFGHNGGNVEQGRMMLAREIRVHGSKKKGIYLSAVRSFIFNEILAERIKRGLWGKTLDGDVFDDKHLSTGAMWGRGRVTTSSEVQNLENEVAMRFAELCEGLEHAGLKQERRSLVAMPENFSWHWEDEDTLQLNFSLKAGQYATSVIAEILEPQETVRLNKVV